VDEAVIAAICLSLPARAGRSGDLVLVFLQRDVERSVELRDRAGNDDCTAGGVGLVHTEAVAARKSGDSFDLRRVSAVAGGKFRFREPGALRRRRVKVVCGRWDGRPVRTPSEHDSDA